MSDANQPVPGTPPPPGGGVQYTYGEKNAFLAFLQQPRIMLLLLAGWSILCSLSQAFTDSQLFSEAEGDIDGLLAGLTFGWEGLALAAVYIYCFRNPDRYPKVFWLAGIHMGVLTASILFHWLITGLFSISNVIVPLAGTLTLDFLVFVHIFGEDEETEVKS
jgi:hypothetical protein